jgi:hypothetical protein
MKEQKRICKNCTYYESHGGDLGTGDCHRYPPTPTPDHDSWPAVNDLDWCGECWLDIVISLNPVDTAKLK